MKKLNSKTLINWPFYRFQYPLYNRVKFSRQSVAFLSFKHCYSVYGTDLDRIIRLNHTNNRNCIQEYDSDTLRYNPTTNISGKFFIPNCRTMTTVSMQQTESMKLIVDKIMQSLSSYQLNGSFDVVGSGDATIRANIHQLVKHLQENCIPGDIDCIDDTFESKNIVSNFISIVFHVLQDKIDFTGKLVKSENVESIPYKTSEDNYKLQQQEYISMLLRGFLQYHCDGLQLILSLRRYILTLIKERKSMSNSTAPQQKLKIPLSPTSFDSNSTASSPNSSSTPSSNSASSPFPRGQLYNKTKTQDLVLGFSSESSYASSTEESSLVPFTFLTLLDNQLQTIITQNFCRSLLRLDRLTLDSPAHVIETIAIAESVHPTDRLWRLRRRFGYGRRVFAFSHCSDQKRNPCAFIHVAMTPEVAPTMGYLGAHTGNRLMEPSVHTMNDANSRSQPFQVANFYSVASFDPALKGTNIARYLIYDVATYLHETIPSLHTFCTLSPVPLFRLWLRKLLTQLKRDSSLAERVGELSIPILHDHHITSLLQLRDIQISQELNQTPAEYSPFIDALSCLSQALSEHITHVPAHPPSPDIEYEQSSEQNKTINDTNMHRDEMNTNLWNPSVERIIREPALHLLDWYIRYAPSTVPITNEHIQDILNIQNKQADMPNIPSSLRNRPGLPHCPVARFHMSNGAILRRVNFCANATKKGMMESGGMMINYEYKLDTLASTE